MYSVLVWVFTVCWILTSYAEIFVTRMFTSCNSDFRFVHAHADAFVEHLKEELNMAEAESAKISSEIEVLTRNHVEGKMLLF